MTSTRLTADELARYRQISQQALVRPLSATEQVEWKGFGERYAVQLEEDRQAHLERRKADMDEWLGEKKAYDEAKAEHEARRATAYAAHLEGVRLAEQAAQEAGQTPPVPAMFNFPAFQRQPVARDFVEWLAAKGRL